MTYFTKVVVFLLISVEEIIQSSLKWQIYKTVKEVGARMAGVSVTKTAELFRIARSTVSKVMTAFEKKKKKEKSPH